MISGKQKKAFDEFYATARFNDTLEPKTTAMVHMAAAMGMGCYP